MIEKEICMLVEYYIGKRVILNHDGKTIEGTIICIYAVPKNWDLIDVQTEDGILHGVSTEEIVNGIG